MTDSMVHIHRQSEKVLRVQQSKKNINSRNIGENKNVSNRKSTRKVVSPCTS